jgi:hypothetical protein
MDENDNLPPDDAAAGLVRERWDAGDHIIEHVVTVDEALDEGVALKEPGGPGKQWRAETDEAFVQDDGRPVAIHYSPAAREQLDADDA